MAARRRQQDRGTGAVGRGGRAAWRLWCGFLLGAALVSCAPPKPLPPLAGELVYEPPSFDTSRIATVAVLPFENLAAVETAGEALASDLEHLLTQPRYYKVVTRAELEEVLRERDLVLEKALDPDRAIQIGKLVGAEALLTGTIHHYGVENAHLREDRGTSYVKRVGRIVVHVKVIGTESGAILWSEKLDRWWGWKESAADNPKLLATSDYDLLERARQQATAAVMGALNPGTYFRWREARSRCPNCRHVHRLTHHPMLRQDNYRPVRFEPPCHLVGLMACPECSTWYTVRITVPETVAGCAFLGVWSKMRNNLLDLDTTVIGRVIPGSPAEGVLQSGDRVLAVEGNRVSTWRQLSHTVAHAQPGQRIRLAFERDGETHEREFTLVERPASVLFEGQQLLLGPGR